MILGLGIDLVEVARIEKALAKGERFTRRLFSPGEAAYCNRHKEPARHFAARFAAKEAGMKALGTGWSNGVGWKDFEVRHDPHGRPHLYVTGRAAAVVAIEGDGLPPEAHSFTTGRTRIGVEAPAFVPVDAAPPADPA